MNRYSLALVLLAALSGCSSTGTADRPQPALSAEVAGLGAPADWAFGAGADGEIAADWSSIISDPVLLDLMSQALSANPNLRATEESVRRAEAFLRQSRSNLLPFVNASAGASASSPFEDFDLGERYTLGLDASWEADLWGAIRSGIAASEYDLQAAETFYRASREALAAAVARAYVVAIDAGRQVELTRATLAAQVETQRIVNIRYELGAADRGDQVLAESDVASARDSLETSLAAQRSAVRALQVLLGRYPDGSMTVPDALPVVADVVIAGQPADLLRRRPDVLSAEASVRSAFASTRVVRAGRWPSLSLSGGVSSATDSLGDLVDPAALALSLGARLADTLFDGGLTAARIEAAEAGGRLALANYGSAVLDAYADVEGRLDDVETLRRRATYVETASANARETLQLAEIQYKEGAIDLLDVLTFRQRSFQADRTLLSLRRSEIESRIALYLSLGGAMTPLPTANDGQS
ncbi:efflux transporter outer membrane subunit [Hyphomonas johnsonii]|uniref:NodT family RND efflux system outer membrane lipoprotein n=1 Tax=Hyphomonas johnsonii MHS-2 TaxID=1280950 RepID=A0A059FHB5_9PROT|nr:efflux transporter outer membrane subunit [Hyphomonas johnsonii]KCZ90014.1 NodT family RND efflux system outer membrane lipoprotein [Hyphomonas johnsonii MHS-2]